MTDRSGRVSLPRLPRIPPVLTAIIVGVAVGGLLVLVSGGDPLAAYVAIVTGALAWSSLPDTLNWAVPLVGMTLVAALPLRGGMVNLGGDGQLVIGGLVAALVPLHLAGPGGLVIAVSILAAMIAGGVYAMIPAWGEIRHGVPMLITSLLLSYPAIGLASYLVGFPLRDMTTGLAQTAMIPQAARLPVLSGPLTIGFFIMSAVAILVVLFDRFTVGGYELRMRGLNARFAGYGGVPLARQTVAIMFASGAIAGLVGALIVLGAQFRFQDGALLSPGYTWSGLMAALLAGGEPLGAILAGAFFAALQTGGFAMQRETAIPRVLTMVMQAIIILFLAMRHGIGRGRTMR